MKTVRRPPYPKWNPGYFPCSSLTPLPLPSRRPSVSFGGFGLKRGLRLARLGAELLLSCRLNGDGNDIPTNLVFELIGSALGYDTPAIDDRDALA